MAIDLTKFIVRFIEEARDHLQQLNDGLSLLEQNQGDAETINSIFRSAHTIKGSSRMLKLNTMSELAHKMEDLLGGLRDNSLSFSPEMAALLYSGLDHLSQLVDALDISKDPSKIPPLNASLMTELDDFFNGHKNRNQTTEPPLPQVTEQAVGVITQKPEQAEKIVATPEPKLKTTDTVRIRLSKLDELLSLMSEVVSSQSLIRHQLTDSQKLERSFNALNLVQPAYLQQLQHFNRSFKDNVQMQDTQMAELLDKLLIMRMLPLSIVFEPAARLIRELGSTIGKKVSALVRGADIELDRQLIDGLADPIIHLIRNGIDHGIEPEATRKALGKPAQGKITLSAKQDAGWVVIEISDDGAGIPLDMVLDKAIRKGLITEEQSQSMTDKAILDLIFLPGFSTNAIITVLSGRGVGMDVVKKVVIDQLQGGIHVETKADVGTTFVLRLPMSLAVMRVLLVEAAGQRWGFTSQYVSELIKIPASNLLTVAERQVMILRNEFVPIVPLTDLLLNTTSKNNLPTEILLVVLTIRNEKLALIIDQLVDERDMVIKPLPPHLRFLERVSGMVITGENELVNILHGPALLNLARKLQMNSLQALHDDNADDSKPTTKNHILVVDDSLNTREIEKDVLEAYGYHVTLAEDGLDGLNKAQTEDFDAVLTDVEMPNMDGFSLTSALRQLPSYEHKPIIIITSLEKEEDKRRGVKVGADAYIVKGDFDQSSLIDTLKALLG